MHRKHRGNNDSVAIGRFAGEDSSTEYTVSVGRKAGNSNQAEHAIAIGDQAGVDTQGTYAIAIGDKAGKDTQGVYAIAIGALAGTAGQPDNSIILNGTSAELYGTDAGLYINPIRQQAKGSTILCQNPNTFEVSLSFPNLPVYADDASATADWIKANTVKVNPKAYPVVAPPPAPTKPSIGSSYYDSTKKKVKVFDGTAWIAQTDEKDIAALKKKLGIT